MRGPPGDLEKCFPKSAFAVKLREAPPKPFQPIVFQESLYNQGHNFNLTSGEFTCTDPGMYNFGFDITLLQSSVKIRLMKNGVVLREKRAEAKDSRKYAYGTLLVPLEEQDKVWLESVVNESESEQGTTEIVFFGYLLYRK